MNDQIFRQKSIDRMSSPEDLHDYMHISNPRLWMVLSVILVLLVGFIIYASVVTMENTLQTTAKIDYFYAEDGSTSGTNYLNIAIPLQSKDIIKRGMTVRIGKDEAEIEVVFENEDGVEAGAFWKDSSVSYQPGTYDAEIILEQISPISFLLN